MSLKVEMHPWGDVDDTPTPVRDEDTVRYLNNDVAWIDTPVHGGLAVTVYAAVEELSESTLKNFTTHRIGDVLFFEEDECALHVLNEVPEWMAAFKGQRTRR